MVNRTPRRTAVRQLADHKDEVRSPAWTRQRLEPDGLQSTLNDLHDMYAFEESIPDRLRELARRVADAYERLDDDPATADRVGVDPMGPDIITPKLS